MTTVATSTYISQKVGYYLASQKAFKYIKSISNEAIIILLSSRYYSCVVSLILVPVHATSGKLVSAHAAPPDLLYLLVLPIKAPYYNA